MAKALNTVVLLVLDGVGIGPGDQFDSVAQAATPVLDNLRQHATFRTLRAHGRAVGLPSDDDMGNSEVGHNTLGAGRVLDQGATLVDAAIENGSLFDGEVWDDVIRATNNGTLHLIGLFSDGGVHSSLDHLEAIVTAANTAGCRRVRIHALFDGRDVPDFTAADYVAQLRQRLHQLHDLDWCFASGGGRMAVTMDRYGADWSVVESGWKAHVLGTAKPVSSVEDGIRWGRGDSNTSDQYLPAFTVVDGEGVPVGAIADGDAVVLFNFRGDRAIELAQAFDTPEDEAFPHFERVRVPKVSFAGLVKYDADTDIPKRALLTPPVVSGTVSEHLAAMGVRQWACAETHKFGHVTYFWNGNRSDKFDEKTETYLEIRSDLGDVAADPGMKSAETAEAVIAALRSGEFDFLRANFAAGDMVGHTGDAEAARKAVEAVDTAIGRVALAVEEAGATLVIVADHGNADDMVQRATSGSVKVGHDGRAVPKTSHTCNPVPFIVYRPGRGRALLRSRLPEAGLANVAATLLDLLGVPKPEGFEPSLVVVEPHLVLLRHAESEGNAAALMQGRYDYPLSSKGVQQCAQASHAVLAWRMPLMATSELSRSVRTAELLGLGAGPTDPRWSERDAGPWTGMRRQEVEKRSGTTLSKGHRPEGFEPVADVVSRMQDAAQQALAEGGGIVITHGAAMRAFACALGWGGEKLANLEGLAFDKYGVLIDSVCPTY